MHYTLIHPTIDFGLETSPLSAVAGGDKNENAATMTRLLSNSLLPTETAILNFVLLNAAALIQVAGLVDSFKAAVPLARHSIESGGAKLAFDFFKNSCL